jgi:hypothetical protein
MEEIKLVKVRSKQPGVVARHFGNPSFEYRFDEEPIEMMSNIADFLVKDNPNF